MESGEPKSCPLGVSQEALDTVRFIIRQQQTAHEQVNTFWCDNTSILPLEAPEVLGELNAAQSMLDTFAVFLDYVDIMYAHTLAQVGHAEDAHALEDGKHSFLELLEALIASGLVNGELAREGNRTISVRTVAGTLIGTRHRRLLEITAKQLPELAHNGIEAIEINKRMQFALPAPSFPLQAHIHDYRSRGAHGAINLTPSLVEELETVLDKGDRTLITPIATTYYASVIRSDDD